MTIDFSFGRLAGQFDAHIDASVPGRSDLLTICRDLSSRFIQDRTKVIDVGCTTGRLLEIIHDHNKSRGRHVQYVGLEIEEAFKSQFKHRSPRLRFKLADVRTYPRMENASLVLSIFTLQFIRHADKAAVLNRLFNALVPGGALIIAEKTLAESSRFQDALTFPFYDRKLASGFSETQLLEKERQLRGQMTLFTESELRSQLFRAGFDELQTIWSYFPFIAVAAVKL